MRPRFNTLFGRLFGVLMLAIVLAHLLAFIWFHHYGGGPPPPPPKLLTRPIKRLSEAAERLSEDLDSPPLDETGPWEARQAAATFNLMQQRIREQVQQRGRMLGAVSHDLRTPLSRLKLRLEQIDDVKLQGQMRQDLNDMIGMLDATLSYLHEQRTSETLQWMDVQALVESLCENAQDQGAQVRASGHCAPLLVQPMALRSCLNNLMSTPAMP